MKPLCKKIVEPLPMKRQVMARRSPQALFIATYKILRKRGISVPPLKKKAEELKFLAVHKEFQF